MATTERIDIQMTDKKIGTRISLVEQSQTYMHQTLDRIEKKIDTLDRKVEKIESSIYSNLKWIVGLSVPTLLTVIGLAIEASQYIKYQG